MVSGIHHVTGITAAVQANVDFYAGFLGLHLVKQTGGYEDGEQLHLFYGDATGSPGSLLSFLIWEAAGRGRTGLGQVSEVALRVPAASIGDWLGHALGASVPVEGPVREFGASVLRLKDPDGMIVKLVGDRDMPAAPEGGRLMAGPIAGVTLLVEEADETADFVARFGYRAGASEGALRRLVSDQDYVDIRQVAGFVASISGAGVPDHVAFRAADLEALRSMRLDLRDYGATSVHDRQYFHSLYVRDPAGILIEYATDGPGMAVDEDPAQLGQELKFAPHDRARAEEIRLRLPQFVAPDAPRCRLRDLPFVHRFHFPKDPDGSTIVLLHGTGGNEADLMPFAHRLNPRATLLGLRGRASEEGQNRWFRRLDAARFDQADIADEVAAFAAFLAAARAAYGLGAKETLLLGYSNGANFLSAYGQSGPQDPLPMILLRSRQVREGAPGRIGEAASVLILNGQEDAIVTGPSPGAGLEAAGYAVCEQTVAADHALGPEDEARARQWMAAHLSSG